MPVGRAEQQGMERLFDVAIHVASHFHEDTCLFGVFQIGFCGVLKSPDVIEGMVANAVTLLHYLTEFVGMLADVVAHHEERGLDIVLRQQIEHPGCHLGDGAIVESEVDSMLLGLYPPQGRGVELADKLGRLFYQHGEMISG